MVPGRRSFSTCSMITTYAGVEGHMMLESDNI